MKLFKRYKNTKSLLLVLPMFLLLGSCGKGFLDILPELDLPEDNAFDTKTRIEAQINGLYGTLKHGEFYAGRYQIYNDIRGEEFIVRVPNNVTGNSVYQFSNDPTDTYVGNFWTRGYLTINRINKFLQDIEDAPAGVITVDEKTAFIAEAKFIRGLSYYALIQLFAKPYGLDQGASRGIPLRLSAETSTANNELKSSPVKDVYEQILKDLDASEAGLPLSYSSAEMRTTRAHRNTAIALKTRVYLAMKDYPNVIKEANKIVSSGAPFIAATGVGHQLHPNVEEIYTAFTTLENILSWPYETTNAPGTQNQLGYYYNIGNIEYYLNNEGEGIYANQNWGLTDKRRTELTEVSSAINEPILIKWGGTPYLDWVPVIRYAEVLLNLAEAEAEVGSESRALALLQAVRSRSDASYNFPSITSRKQLVDFVLLERRIELLGEGFRAADLQRRLTPIPSVGAGKDIDVSEDRYVFPIPVDELLTNPSVK